MEYWSGGVLDRKSPFHPLWRLCRNRRTSTDVILSTSEESLFSNAYEERSFGYCLRMTLRQQSLGKGERGGFTPVKLGGNHEIVGYRETPAHSCDFTRRLP